VFPISQNSSNHVLSSHYFDGRAITNSKERKGKREMETGIKQREVRHAGGRLQTAFFGQNRSRNQLISNALPPNPTQSGLKNKHALAPPPFSSLRLLKIRVHSRKAFCLRSLRFLLSKSVFLRVHPWLKTPVPLSPSVKTIRLSSLAKTALSGLNRSQNMLSFNTVPPNPAQSGLKNKHVFSPPPLLRFLLLKFAFIDAEPGGVKTLWVPQLYFG